MDVVPSAAAGLNAVPGSVGDAKTPLPHRNQWLVGFGGLTLVALYTILLAFSPGDGYLRIQSNWVYPLVPAAALLLCAIPIAQRQGRERLGWISLAFLLLSWVLGDLTYTYYDVRYATDPPFPGLADILYYFGYGAFVSAIVLLLFPAKRIADGRWILDALTVMVVAGSLSWVYLLEPIIATGGYSARDAAIAMGYPLLDLVVLAVVILALYASGGRLQLRGLLLMTSAALLVAADSGYTYLVSTVGYDSIGNPLDPLWLSSYLLIGVCCLLPSQKPYDAPPRRQSLLGLMLPYAFAIPILGLAITNEALGTRSGVLAAAAVVVGVLIVGRQFLTLRENLALFKALEREGEARRLLLARVVTAQEDERHRVSLDLHDGPVQSLSFLATRLGSARKFLDRGETARAKTIIEEVEASVKGEVQGVREVMMDLRPPSLEERGLDAALRDLAREASRQSDLKIETTGSVGRRVTTAAESIIYRLAQEAITNARKHAQATTVNISLSADSANVVLRVTDDGKGFDLTTSAELAAAGRYGLLGMMERTALLGGRCSWHRREPSGTEFAAYIPIEEESSAAA